MRTVDPVKHEQKRREIMAAAERCFTRSGLRGATIAQICAEAGISPGHLYHYFPSKEAIISALAEVKLAEASRRLETLISGEGSILNALPSEMNRIRQWAGEHSAVLLFEMLAEAPRNPAMARALHNQTRGMKRLLADTVRQAQSRGEIDRELDSEMAAAVLIGLIDASKTLQVRDPDIDAAKAASMMKLLIDRFLSTPSTTR